MQLIYHIPRFKFLQIPGVHCVHFCLSLLHTKDMKVGINETDTNSASGSPTAICTHSDQDMLSGWETLAMQAINYEGSLLWNPSRTVPKQLYLLNCGSNGRSQMLGHHFAPLGLAYKLSCRRKVWDLRWCPGTRSVCLAQRDIAQQCIRRMSFLSTRISKMVGNLALTNLCPVGPIWSVPFGGTLKQSSL